MAPTGCAPVELLGVDQGEMGLVECDGWYHEALNKDPSGVDIVWSWNCQPEGGKVRKVGSEKTIRLKHKRGQKGGWMAERQEMRSVI